MSPEEKLLRAIFVEPRKKNAKSRVITPKTDGTLKEKAGERHDSRPYTRH